MAAAVADWSEFRGPTGQGHAFETALPLGWSTTKNVTWKAPLQGEGWSSPVVIDGKVILTSAIEKGDALSLHVVAYAVKSGKKLWDKGVLQGRENKKHKKNSHASPTPIVEDGKIYAHFGPNGTVCLDLSGKVLWKQTSLPYPPVHGNGGSPIIVDDKLIFSCDGSENPFVVALAKSTGKVLWKRARKSDATRKFSFCTPLLIEVDGVKQVITPGSGVVYALNPDDGSVIWECFYDQGYSVVPRPVFAHGLVFVGTGFNKPRLKAIRPTGRGDVTETHVAWEVDRGISKTPSFVVVGDEIYVVADSGVATCLDAKTGKEHWNERIGGNYSSSPTYADNKIYVHSEEGKTVVLKPGKEFKVLAENELGEKIFASLAISDGALFLRSESNLYRIEEGR